MTEEKRFCCCGVKAWTRSIGWFHIAGIVYYMIDQTYIMLKPSAKATLEKEYERNMPNSDKEEILFTIKVLTAVFFFYLVVSLFMDVLLLRGSYSKNPKMLLAWMLYTALFVIVNFILIIAQRFYLAASEDASTKLMSKTTGILTDCFCVYVVNLHKREMQENRSREGDFKTIDL